jgi:hypothetical protein
MLKKSNPIFSSAANPMEIQYSKSEWVALSHALNDIRDSFTRMSFLLSDLLSEMKSPERDDVVNEVERRLAQIFDSEPRTHE